jgi:hypothetical protein
MPAHSVIFLFKIISRATKGFCNSISIQLNLLFESREYSIRSDTANQDDFF